MQLTLDHLAFLACIVILNCPHISGGGKDILVRVSTICGELKIFKPSTPTMMLSVFRSVSFDSTHISETPQFFKESASAGPCFALPKKSVRVTVVSEGTWKYNEQ